MNNIRFKIKFFVVLIGGVIALFLIGKIFSNVNPSFNVVANTEFIEFSTNQKVLSSYNLFNSKLYHNDSIIHKNFNGVLKLSDSTTIRFIKNTNHDLFINIDSKLPNKKVAQLYDHEETYIESFQDHLYIKIENTDSLTRMGVSLVFPIRGSIELGKSVDFLSVGDIVPILRNGKIDIILKSLFGRKHYIANEQKLEMGDVFIINNNNGIGFVNVLENTSYLNTSFRAKGKEAYIIKPGPKLRNKNGDVGIVVSASLLDRFLHDDFFTVISLIITILVLGLSISTFFFDYNGFKNNNSK